MMIDQSSYLVKTKMYQHYIKKRRQTIQSRTAIRGGVYTLGQFKKHLARVTGQPEVVLSTEYKSDGGYLARQIENEWGAL